jgi:uncharacterized protein YndB with AHSA1/START domain
MSTATTSPTDRIEKHVSLDAPTARVWRALTDVAQFSAWFGIDLPSPFTVGSMVTGHLRSPKYAQFAIPFWIETMEAERLFAFRWHPYALEEGIDYDAEPTTLVTFTLEAVATGTHLTIVESGFDAIPASRRVKAFTMNSNGWNGQAENLRKYLAA